MEFAHCVVLIAGLVIPATRDAVIPPGVTPPNCGRLRHGMTRAQVEALFGRAVTKKWDYRETPVSDIDPKVLCWTGEWRGPRVVVTVFFTDKDTVTDAFWESPPGSWNLIPLQK